MLATVASVFTYNKTLITIKNPLIIKTHNTRKRSYILKLLGFVASYSFDIKHKTYEQ